MVQGSQTDSVVRTLGTHFEGQTNHTEKGPPREKMVPGGVTVAKCGKEVGHQFGRQAGESTL
jgi:hypothetical protein